MNIPRNMPLHGGSQDAIEHILLQVAHFFADGYIFKK